MRLHLGLLLAASLWMIVACGKSSQDQAQTSATAKPAAESVGGCDAIPREGGLMPQIEWMLTERQWRQIAPLLPKLRRGPKGGRPWVDDRAALEGILWALKTGAGWRDLPSSYPSPATCWRRLTLYEQLGIWDGIWRKLFRRLDRRSRLKVTECFVDATFASAKGGAIKLARPAGVKARR